MFEMPVADKAQDQDSPDAEKHKEISDCSAMDKYLKALIKSNKVWHWIIEHLYQK